MAKHNGLVVVWQETESKVYRPFAFRFNKAKKPKKYLCKSIYKRSLKVQP